MNIKNKTIRILAIESSCDETAAAVIHVTCNMKHVTKLEIKSNIVSSQVKLHAQYGGVYPELASREHVRNIIPVISESLNNIAEFPISKSQFPNKFQIQNTNSSNIENYKIEKFNENCKLKIVNSIDAIAVTVGPGLIGSLLVGVNTAKTLAYALKKPIYAINHLEGHIYSAFGGEFLNPKSETLDKFQITNNKSQINSNFQNPNKLKSYDLQAVPKFPILALIVSGGHTSLVYMKDHLDYQVIGETLDDAAGEAFDKVAKLLGLGYPGGPLIAEQAMRNTKFETLNSKQTQNPKSKTNLKSKILNLKSKIIFPRPMIDSGDFNFSFSGLKTAVLYTWQKLKIKSEKLKTKSEILNLKSKICFEFQEAVVDTLVTKTLRAAKEYGTKSIILCGGVSANDELRRQFELGIRNYELGDKSSKKLQATSYKLDFFVPSKSLSTDNAAMIGIAAAYRVALGKKPIPWYDVNADSNLKLE